MTMRRVAEALILAAWMLAVSVAAGADEPAAPPRYATTPMIEPDRCATAWVIRRYLHPNATFEFHERADMPDGVILFDLAEAELKRDARRATVEMLIEKKGLTDPFVKRLASLIHDIEINAWARRDDVGSPLFQQVLMEEILAAGTTQAGLKRCFSLLDLLRRVNGQIEVWTEQVESADQPGKLR